MVVTKNKTSHLAKNPNQLWWELVSGGYSGSSYWPWWDLARGGDTCSSYLKWWELASGGDTGSSYLPWWVLASGGNMLVALSGPRQWS